ncbi:hypothetical protein, partial [Bacillus sp. JJ1764]|uniref:hypothetical protein n=1 Tax=Bacillus sp. JJ1764 TaxID=3122964 RepID=UPI002FFE8F9C
METYNNLVRQFDKKTRAFEMFHLFLAIIIIAWLNNGIFTFLMPYVINYIRWGLFFVWFGLALIIRRKFVQIFIFQCWPLLVFYLYINIISIFVNRDLSVYIK